jgi:hypothetical protein
MMAWSISQLFFALSVSWCQYQSAKLGGSPKPDACTIVHGRIKWIVPQTRGPVKKKRHIVSKVDFISYCM